MGKKMGAKMVERYVNMQFKTYDKDDSGEIVVISLWSFLGAHTHTHYSCFKGEIDWDEFVQMYSRLYCSANKGVRFRIMQPTLFLPHRSS